MGVRQHVWMLAGWLVGWLGMNWVVKWITICKNGETCINETMVEMNEWYDEQMCMNDNNAFVQMGSIHCTYDGI